MPRPSIKAERTEQILHAFSRCVARYGLEGTSLERIADEAQLKRSLVRHFVGNRQELVVMLAQRVIDDSDRMWEVTKQNLPAQHPVKQLLAYLFDEKYSDVETVLVISALISASSNDPILRVMMQGWMTHFIDEVSQILKREYSGLSDDDFDAAAFGLVSIYFNIDSLSPLQLCNALRKHARMAASMLIAQLDAKCVAAEPEAQ